MTASKWFLIASIVLTIITVGVALSTRFPRRVRIAALAIAWLWGLALALDSLLELSLVPGDWELTGVMLLAWMTGEAWRTRLLTRPA